MMLTYKVYFRVALYPEGVKGYHFEEEEADGVTHHTFIEDTDVFKQYLCTKEQSDAVLNKFINEYDNSIDETIYELRYEDNGTFYCKIKLNDKEWLNKNDYVLQLFLEELLWPPDTSDNIIVCVNGIHYNLDLKVDYFTECLEEEEEKEPEEEEPEEKEQYKSNSVYYTELINNAVKLLEEFDNKSQPKNQNQHEQIEFI